jgi:hypothetical protein
VAVVRTFVTDVPSVRQLFGPVGTTAKVAVPWPVGPAKVSAYVETPIGKGISSLGIDPLAGVRKHVMAPPVEFLDRRMAPSRVRPANQILGNAIIVVPPCNTLLTQRIRPTKIICPQLSQSSGPGEVAAAAHARGGHPRSIRLPNAVTTPAPSVVTRWATYG